MNDTETPGSPTTTDAGAAPGSAAAPAPETSPESSSPMASAPTAPWVGRAPDSGPTSPGASPIPTSAVPQPGMFSLFFGQGSDSSRAEEEGGAVRFLGRLPLKKMLIWGTFLWLLYVLKSFFGLILVTFVLSYIATSLVDRCHGWLRGRIPRRLLVVVFYLALLAALTGFGWATLPRVFQQGRTLLGNLQAAVTQVDAPTGTIPDETAGASRWLQATVASFVGQPRYDEWRAGWLTDELVAEAAELVKGASSSVLQAVQRLLRTTVSAVLQFLAALLFSFLVVIDIPRLGRALSGLAHSRLGGAYREVAPSVTAFARLLGEAFQVQTLIAVANTILTALGMLAIGIHPIGVLSVFVFVCSFIPVAGVFISTVPIGLVALQEGGIGKLLLVILMVSLVHLFEAYILNPRFYSMRMKMHPLATLLILYVAEHLFGVWGLVVCVPLALFVYRYLILGETDAGGADSLPAPPH